MNEDRRNLNIIGTMSGTSMDAINVTLVNSDGNSLSRYNIQEIFEYSNETKKLLSNYLEEAKQYRNNTKLKNHLINKITIDHYKAINNLCSKTKIIPDLLGFHGQTVFHNPKEKISVQLGDASLLSNLSKRTVISDFRSNDIANGGEGAPLAPIYHKLLMQQLNLNLPSCFINIGGIANLTFWNGETLIGFDTGPGNCLMDTYMQRKFGLNYDENGLFASKGKIINKIKDKILNEPFYKKLYPKSLDKSYFDDVIDFVLVEGFNPTDVMATFSECTYLSILNAIKQLPSFPKNFTIMGGGAHNIFLINKLKTINSNEVKIAQEKNINGDFIEAELIAYLSARSFYNLPITFPTTTGIMEPTSGGRKFTPKL